MLTFIVLISILFSGLKFNSTLIVIISFLVYKRKNCPYRCSSVNCIQFPVLRKPERISYLTQYIMWK